MTVACKRFPEGQPGGEQGGDDVRKISAKHPHHHHHPHSPPPHDDHQVKAILEERGGEVRGALLSSSSSWWSSRPTHIRRGRRRGMRSRPRLAMLLTNFNPWLYSTLRLYFTSLYSRRSSVVEHPTEYLLLKTACDKSGETWSFAAAFASIASKLFENYGTFEALLVIRSVPTIFETMYIYVWSAAVHRNIADFPAVFF